MRPFESFPFGVRVIAGERKGLPGGATAAMMFRHLLSSHSSSFSFSWGENVHRAKKERRRGCGTPTNLCLLYVIHVHGLVVHQGCLQVFYMIRAVTKLQFNHAHLFHVRRNSGNGATRNKCRNLLFVLTRHCCLYARKLIF